MKEAKVDDYAMLAYIDFDHPLFSAFSDARFADFSSIKFWQHRNLVFSEEDRADGDWSVIAKFDSGTPAIVDVSVGESGKLTLFAAGWQPTDSQFALSTRFPPLLTRVLSLASPVQKDQLVQTVGDVVRPGELVSSADWSIQFPDKSTQTAAEIATLAREASGATSASSDLQAATVKLYEPGRYIITGKSGDEEYSVLMIAGLAASESQTEMLPVGQLQVLGIGVESETNELPGELIGAEKELANGQLSSNELERRQKWWRWLLLAGLACLIVESLWASAIERRRAAEVV